MLQHILFHFSQSYVNNIIRIFFNLFCLFANDVIGGATKRSKGLFLKDQVNNEIHKMILLRHY